MSASDSFASDPHAQAVLSHGSAVSSVPPRCKQLSRARKLTLSAHMPCFTPRLCSRRLVGLFQDISVGCVQDVSVGWVQDASVGCVWKTGTQQRADKRALPRPRETPQHRGTFFTLPRQPISLHRRLPCVCRLVRNQAERLLASNNPSKFKVHTLFSVAPGKIEGSAPAAGGNGGMGMGGAPPLPPPPVNMWTLYD